MRHVTVVRDERTVLNDFNLRIDSGEHVAILGPNGCGKSTFIKTITRELYPLFTPQTRVRLYGEDHWNIGELRARLGIVSNDIDPFLSRATNGRDTILSGFFGSIGLASYHHVTPAMQARVDELLGKLGIEHLGQRIIGEMSSGETRRVLIARALVNRPHALLFDEPSNCLDVHAQHELRQTMSQLARAGLSLLLVTHFLPDIVPEIDRILLLRQGQVLADGPKHELLTSQRLSQLFDCPLEVTERDGVYHLLS